MTKDPYREQQLAFSENGWAATTEEEFIGVRNDLTQDAFKEKNLPSFWSPIASSYPKVPNTAIRHLMPFPST